jgi:very-short-patch-repair endonuclease
MTPQEVKLWNRLLRLRPQGHHFRRQVPIGRVIVDFACLKARLVIEIDGGQHAREPFMKRDGDRDLALEALGFRVLRFWNAEVDENPDAMICMATLTGAARVALGTDIMPFFTDDDALAAALATHGAAVRDPVWRMPFHPAYEAQIEPGIADLDNAPSGGMGGAITAALFLRRFVTACPSFVHFDIYAWQATAAPARPKGGLGMGARALLGALPERLGL